VQHNCSAKADKVLCDFSNNEVKSMSLINEAEMPITNIRKFHKMTTPELFKEVCAINGTQLAEVNSVEDIYKIIMLALETNFMFHKDMGIIVG